MKTAVMMMLSNLLILIIASEAIAAILPVNILINESTENPESILEVESYFPTNNRNSFTDLVKEQWETFKVRKINTRIFYVNRSL